MALAKDYCGKRILENAEYQVATVLKRNPDETSVLVKLHDGTNLLIIRTLVSFQGHDNTVRFTVHTGMGVDKLAQQTAQHNNMAHNLLLEMRA